MLNVILWYIWVQVFALTGWWVAAHWLQQLPDRGYGISKTLGLLLGGFAYWIIVTLGLSLNDPGAVLFGLALVVVVGILIRALDKHPIPDNERARSILPAAPLVITIELIFALAFVACAIYRAYNPDIVEAGGEKFMESMYLNAILRSPTFPPHDAWLSGFSISYYYFGYALMAMVTKITGVPSAIAFNLSGAMFFALTLVSAFSVGYNLWARYKLQLSIDEAKHAITPPAPLKPRRRKPPARPQAGNLSDDRLISPQQSGAGSAYSRSAIVAGLLTAIMLGVMGNMGGLMESVRCARLLPQSFWVWLDVRQIDTQPIECSGIIPTRFYWWWDWSRVVHDYTPNGADQEVITETPAFSTILGDNHPHVMSLPFVLLAITLALYYLGKDTGQTQCTSTDDPTKLEQKPGRNPFINWTDGLTITQFLALHGIDLVLTSLVLGGLSFMNTWDFPVYGALVIGALLLKRWHTGASLLPSVIFGLLVFVLGYVLYAPFYATFASQARGIGVNLFNGTRFIQLFLMFAPFIVAITIFVFRVAHASLIPFRYQLRKVLVFTVTFIVLALVAVILFGFISPQARAYATEMMSTGSVLGITRDTVMNRLVQRLTDPWVPLFLMATAALCIALIVTKPKPPDDASQPSLVNSFVLLLILGGALLTVAVEFVFLQDLFGTRMNTVFKFYYQAWTVWSVAGAFVFMVLLTSQGRVSTVGAIALGCLVLSGMLFPLYAALSKTNNFSQKPTLDGSAYLQTAKPEDARMIDWLNTNVQGDPVIAEAPADKYGAYSYNGRISAFTGLPTILGWGGHEHQWRGDYTEPARREPLIETLFNSIDVEAAKQVLHEFAVRYVIVGQPERARYSAEGLDKFNQICQSVFQTGNSAIYQCSE
jgi:YYY domain-containing protein